MTFGREFTAAVELKQVAQQEAERARFLVEKAEQQKKAAVISAEGESQAASLLAKVNRSTHVFFTVTNKQVIEWDRISSLVVELRHRQKLSVFQTSVG